MTWSSSRQPWAPYTDSSAKNNISAGNIVPAGISAGSIDARLISIDITGPSHPVPGLILRRCAASHTRRLCGRLSMARSSLSITSRIPGASLRSARLGVTVSIRRLDDTHSRHMPMAPNRETFIPAMPQDSLLSISISHIITGESTARHLPHAGLADIHQGVRNSTSTTKNAATKDLAPRSSELCELTDTTNPAAEKRRTVAKVIRNTINTSENDTPPRSIVTPTTGRSTVTTSMQRAMTASPLPLMMFGRDIEVIRRRSSLRPMRSFRTMPLAAAKAITDVSAKAGTDMKKKAAREKFARRVTPRGSRATS